MVDAHIGEKIVAYTATIARDYFAGLQAELDAACKELDCVKSKLKTQELQLEAFRAKLSDKEDDFNFRYSKNARHLHSFGLDV